MGENDKLTGLMQRKEFDDEFKRQMSDAMDKNEILTLALLDLDFFKNINDEFGHSTGDAVLIQIASILKEVAKKATSIARFGGEEFVLLFPDLEREQAFLIIEQIRSQVEKIKSYGAGKEKTNVKVTISGGVSAFPTDGMNAIEVLRKADQALYRAKTTGRNKICIAQEERMATKTTHYTLTQLERLSKLSKEENVGEAVLLREALDDLLIKYKVAEIES